MTHIVDYSEDIPRCSFCGKDEHQVHRLVAGPGANICDECIALCVEILKEGDEQAGEATAPLPIPSAISAFLDSYVVGQTSAKQALSVAVYNHYKLLRSQSSQTATSGALETEVTPSLDSVELTKSNVLLLGPTGTGKTYLARTLARMMKVPFAIVDATTLTEAGYVGDDVETILQRLLQAADGDVPRAEKGIIYVDEIDKIARKSGENTSITRDVSGEGVQQALLKILEGTLATVPKSGSRKHQDQEMVQIDTKNILFICAGAFVGLDEIISKRLGSHATGFGSPLETRDEEQRKADYLTKVVPQDLIDFGFLPEFVGRLPVVTSLSPLTVDDLKQIMTMPTNALVKQYQKLFSMDDVDLEFTSEAITELATTAMEKGTGARGLRSLFENILQTTMFELPNHPEVTQVVVTREAAEGSKPPQMLAPRNSSASRKKSA